MRNEPRRYLGEQEDEPELNETDSEGKAEKEEEERRLLTLYEGYLNKFFT
jgi:hypothetical protein